MSSVDNLNRVEVEQAQEIIDFRMISFSLGGRDYGIDIMDVKEISKIDNLTYVPNTAAYVRGVYNLRGEIISLIDLRTMFHLPIEEKPAGEPEDVLFLQSGDHMVGVIVDQVNDVVGVSKERIQPPPPVFEEINISYISGVVESADVLFIILDTDLVFGQEIQDAPIRELETAAKALVSNAKPTVNDLETSETAVGDEDLDFTFVKESLQAFSSFKASDLNDEWLRTRFTVWAKQRTENNLSVQLQTDDDAEAFLAPFYGASRRAFWTAGYMQGVKSLLPESSSNAVSAWVVGAGEGYDPYSLACVMRNAYQGSTVSIWAHDTDLLKVSSAPTMLVNPDSVHADIGKHLIETPNGTMFSGDIRKSVYFEYHDVSHENTFPPVQVIIARDFLSFLQESLRNKLIASFRDKLATGGIVIVGDNEKLPGSEWELLESHSVRCYSIK